MIVLVVVVLLVVTNHIMFIYLRLLKTTVEFVWGRIVDGMV